MTVSEAVEKSKMYLTELRPELQNADVQLEELETPPNNTKWTFTFSAIPELPTESSWGKILRSTRISKSVQIDSQTGELLSIKNAAA